jgi:L-asparaginase
MKPEYSNPVIPRIILHGGAGNITRENIPPPKLALYRTALLSILEESNSLLSKPGARALDVAVHAVSLLEDNPLFNCGKGAVFTRAGTNELESSIMVSNGTRKRGVGCMLLRRVKNPIKLAREMLLRGETDDGGGAGGHCQLSGHELEMLAEKWGCEMVDPSYFWTKERWEQHKRGLEKERLVVHNTSSQSSGDATWDPVEYIPQGTVGAVVLDSFGTIAVATSTGGLTNKIPGRIGDTPSLGAGFWAEEWTEEPSLYQMRQAKHTTTPSILDMLSSGNFLSIIQDCFSFANDNSKTAQYDSIPSKKHTIRHAVGLSGTGNGDSFLRLSAVRTTAAISRYSSPQVSLPKAVSQIAGPGGELQNSAGDRWGVTGEGEAGIIGIELIGTQSHLACDYNRGMFRAYMTNDGKAIFGAFRGDD